MHTRAQYPARLLGNVPFEDPIAGGQSVGGQLAGARGWGPGEELEPFEYLSCVAMIGKTDSAKLAA